MKSISIIIPNYNGVELLRKNIPVLLASIGLRSNVFSYEVIIVDDGSQDGSADFIAEAFPAVKLIRLEKNYGFSSACNAGVKAASGEIIYLLNSDIKVSNGFLDALLPYFENEEIFAVSSIDANEPALTNVSNDALGVSFLKFKFGLFWYWYEDISARGYRASGDHGIEVFCVSGGHTAFDRKKYLALGGFDTLFSPFYAEDGDICWRAWKRGWKSLIEPRSVVTHKCQSTISKCCSHAEIQRIHWKNRILMMWKDLTSVKLWCKHLFFIIPGILIAPCVGKSEFSAGVLSALWQLPDLLRARRRDRVKEEVYSDETLFTKFSNPLRFQPFTILFLHETGQLSGAENSLLNLIANLDKERFRVVVACPAEGAFVDRLRCLGVKVYPIDFPQVRKIWGVHGTLNKVRDIIGQEKVGIVHSNSIRTHIYAWRAARLKKIPVVWHERNLIEKEIIDPDRALAFLPDLIICNSDAIARRFIKNGKIPAKVLTIINGVDLSRFSPLVHGDAIRREFGISPEEIVIGIASRFSRNKGHETFLAAAAQLIREIPDGRSKIRFLIAGGAVFHEDMAREETLRALSETLGIQDRTVFIGFRKEMPEVYAAMDIFVLASAAEPCGRVLFEAMASGKPIVATDTGGTPEIVLDGVTGLLVRPADPEALARTLKALVIDRQKREAMGSAARQRAENIFGIDKNVRKTEAVYERLLKR